MEEMLAVQGQEQTETTPQDKQKAQDESAKKSKKEKSSEKRRPNENCYCKSDDTKLLKV